MGAKVPTQHMVFASMLVGSAVSLSANIIAAGTVSKAEAYLHSKYYAFLRPVAMRAAELLCAGGTVATELAIGVRQEPSAESVKGRNSDGGQSACVSRPCVSSTASSASACMITPVLADVVHFLLPLTGPEVAMKLQSVARHFTAAMDREAMMATARSGVWNDFLHMLPPMLELIHKQVDRASIRRAAELHFLMPPGTASIWAKDETGRSPLHLAVNLRSPSLVQAVLEARCDPDAGSREDTWSPLMWAASYGEVEVCHKLLQAGASVNALAKDGSSPLLCGARADKASLDTVTLLLAAGADPARVPMQAPFDEHVEFEVRQALAAYKQKTPKHSRRIGKLTDKPLTICLV